MLKFSIITVCQNAVDTIRDTMASVLAQTYGNYEYLIIDGASADGTVEAAEEISKGHRCVSIYSERDFGIYNAMNRGITRASGDYIIFMNAGDEFYQTDILETAAGIIEKNGTGIYYGRICAVKDKRRVFRIDFADIKGTILTKMLDGLMPAHQSVIAPLSLLKKYYFDEAYVYRADFDWLVKCHKARIPFYYMDFVISKYDMGGFSTSPKAIREEKKETKRVLSTHYPLLSFLWNHCKP